MFLHGSGDTGHGIREWLASASGGKFERTLKELRLGPVVFPTAARRPYTPAGGMPSTVWVFVDYLGGGGGGGGGDEYVDRVNRTYRK